MQLDLVSIDIQEQKITSSHELNAAKFSQRLWQIINQAFIMELDPKKKKKYQQELAKIRVFYSKWRCSEAQKRK